MSMLKQSDGKLKPIWGFVFSLVLSYLAFFVANNIAHEAGDQRPFRTEFFFRLLWMVLLFGVFIWMLTVADHIEDHRIAAQGLPRVRGWLVQFLSGCFIGAVLTVLAVAPIYFRGHFKSHLLMTMQLLPNLGLVLLMLFCGALAEELVFRGYPFQHLTSAIGTVPAVVFFSAFYGALHLLNPNASRWGAVNSALVGVLLSVAYLRTRALWLPWGIHLGWNLMMGFVLGLPVSGFRVFNLWVYTDALGPKELTGGSYGVEASISASVVFLIGVLLMWKLPFRALPQPTMHKAEHPVVRDAEKQGLGIRG
jgi:membrane protease YdiL (CAAX protease family)